jgi:hypothetical protein
MNNSLLIWFKNLAEGWKIFFGLVGAVIIIGTSAIKIDHWIDKGVDQANVIEYLKQSEKDQKTYNRIKDSIDLKKWEDLNVRLKLISDSIRLTLDDQKTLTNAVGTLGSKMTSNITELFNWMGGLKFELVQSEEMKRVFPKTEISIKKVPKDSIK